MSEERFQGTPFATVLERRLSRRALLGGAAAGVLTFVCATRSRSAKGSLGFDIVAPVSVRNVKNRDALVVPRGHRATPLLRWGDPLFSDAPPFDPERQTPAAQEKQFGYNCDYVGYFPLPWSKAGSGKGLLAVNHEYTNPELMFLGYDPDRVNRKQVDVELAAHGMSVVEIERNSAGRWAAKVGSAYNRRLTMNTPFEVTGPARGHELLRTGDDPAGTRVLGTLNNCSGGKTPWGTVLSGEENFQDYFAHLSHLDDGPLKSAHRRYGLKEQLSPHRWDRFYRRFNLAQEPHEPFRFGWVVEFNPYNPTDTPRKRTALGRMRHEAATTVVSKDGHVVVYMGDDDKFEYVYKFVSAGRWDPKKPESWGDLLEKGTLYVAHFDEDGGGEWRPLVYSEANDSVLCPKTGFGSQAEVLIHTRAAADRLGATPMDRAEDIEVNPKDHKVYLAFTNNVERGLRGVPGPDRMNPRALNTTGQVLTLTEKNDDYAARSFTWDVLLLCGDPRKKQPVTWFAGYQGAVSPIACPDNLTFDRAGNLWIASDGAGKSIRYNDGLFAVPVQGEFRGAVQQFLSAPFGAEVCGPEFTPDNTSLFVAIQHPGEGTKADAPGSNWPDGEESFPRPSVVVIQREDGAAIGG